MPKSDMTNQRRDSNSIERQKRDLPLNTGFKWIYPDCEASKTNWFSEGAGKENAVMALQAH